MSENEVAAAEPLTGQATIDRESMYAGQNEPVASH